VNRLDFSSFINSPKSPAIDHWLQQLKPTINSLVEPERHGDLPRWLAALESIPTIEPDSLSLGSAAITTRVQTNEPEQTEALRQSLLALRPWRKGPFDINGVYIDTEWRCDKKWARLQPHIDLRGCNVLDVGCGNGYYGLRMLGDGANSVTGVDPNLLFCTQFQAINRFIKQHRACVLPLSIEHLETAVCHFDKVFSMGVLYHRRNPIEHLHWLHRWLPSHGELILETLVIAGDKAEELIPDGRYANMRNVWSLPTVPLLLEQLQSAGFSSARCVDLTRTSIDEQRQTEWMHFHSLEHALNPDNHTLTIEGHPAPLRAIILAHAG
jgi:tRNA (mo5U34)-methyltransferase